MAASSPAECPHSQVLRECANTCPHTCADLRPQTQCLPQPCQPGCACLPGQVGLWSCTGLLGMGQQPQDPHHPQVLQDGACVPPEECRCTLDPTMPGVLNLSREEREQEHAPGSRLQHRCNTWCVPPAPQHHPTAGGTELGGVGCWVGAEPLSVCSVCIRGTFNCSQEECNGEGNPFSSPCLRRDPCATAGPCSLPVQWIACGPRGRPGPPAQ